jgi:hypothetical protein
MTSTTFYDLIRAAVLMEIVVVLVFSGASMLFYIKRVRSSRNMENHLSWHVVLVGTSFKYRDGE